MSGYHFKMYVVLHLLVYPWHKQPSQESQLKEQRTSGSQVE